MQPEENEVYGAYTLPYQPVSSASVGVLEAPPATDASTEQGIVEPSGSPPEPPSLPPMRLRKRRRPGPAGAIVLLALILALIFGTGLFSGWEFAQASTTTTAGTTSTATSSSTTSLQAQQEAAIAKVEPAVVEIIVTTAQGEQLGSGVIIDAQGDIVTNNHVVSGAQSITVVLSNGSTEQGQLIGTSASNDLAVVRIAPYAHMVVAQLGDSSKLVVGQDVIAVGNPLGITETATEGIVSALNRSIPESSGVTISNAIQTDAPLNPGNSGGALINLQGQLIGITFAGAENTQTNTAADGVNFAIPSNLVQTVVQQILQPGTT
ncbi:MAG: S1C family serine protease [Ktedonobacteraceae bacterium]